MNLIPIFRLITLRNAAVALALAITGAVDASGQITVKGSGMNILDAIKLIEKDSGYTFYFNADDLSGLPALTFNCSGDINKVLDCMFAGSGIDWQVRGNEVSLTKKANVSKNETVRKRMVSGTVLDGSNDEPLIGAVVNVKDTKTNVATDIDGHFDVSFTGNSCTLEISYVGYAKQSVYITDQGTVAVKMQPANEMLGEVVVVGAGTQKKISVTGAIATVKGAEFRAPSSNLTNNLAGKLAGVIAVTNSGEPGSGSSFYIRGINTFGGRTAPLILLDGVEISANDLNNIPPENIESFSILKDASATAIYGARGANGVMLVTTKNGEENTKARISVTYEHSLLQPVNMVEYVDGATYMETYNEAQRMRLGDVTPKYSWERIDNTRAGINQYLYPDVDWRGLMMKKLTQSQRANVNITGGGSRVTYYMSLQMNHDSGALDVPKNYSLNNNHNLWRYIFQNNIEYEVTSSTKLAMRINAQIARNHPGLRNLYASGGCMNAEHAIEFLMAGAMGVGVCTAPILKGISYVEELCYSLSAKLAELIDADMLVILTAVDRVAINWGKPEQKALGEMSVAEAERYCGEGHFAPGSMLPKVQAAISFAKAGGTAIIASLENAAAALRGESGTHITK